jgi:hypothetical protein
MASIETQRARLEFVVIPLGLPSSPLGTDHKKVARRRLHHSSVYPANGEHAENMFRLRERRSPHRTTHGKEDRYFGCIQNRFSQYEEKEKIYITLTRLPASEDDQKGNQSLHCQSGIYQVTHLLCKYIEANCQPATLKTASGSSFTMRNIRRRTGEFLQRKWHTKTRMRGSSLAAHD